MQILCVSQAVSTISRANLQAMKALGRSDVTLKLELIKKPIFLLFLFASMRYGVVALAASMSLYSIVATSFNMFPNKKLMKYSFKEQLEDILHLYIWKELEKIFVANQKERVIFVSVPLLFEAKWQKRFDKIIFISADKKLRLERLIKRNNYSPEYAQMRIQAQDEEENKIKRSDFVVYNNSDFSNLEVQVKDILNKLISC